MVSQQYSVSRIKAIFFSLSVLFLSSCPPESKVVTVQDDLTTYMDQARLWAATEAKINNAISSVRQDQFVHDDYVIETLRPAIGTAREYVTELENYVPNTEALVSVHQGYIEAWRAHEFAMTSVVDAVERQDYIQLSQSNDELVEAQRSVSDVLAALARLLREAGITPEEPSGQPLAPPGGTGGFEVDPSS